MKMKTKTNAWHKLNLIVQVVRVSVSVSNVNQWLATATIHPPALAFYSNSTQKQLLYFITIRFALASTPNPLQFRHHFSEPEIKTNQTNRPTDRSEPLWPDMQFDVWLCLFVAYQNENSNSTITAHCLQRPRTPFAGTLERHPKQNPGHRQHQRQQHLESCKSDTSKRLKWHVVVRIFRLYSNGWQRIATDCLTRRRTHCQHLPPLESGAKWGRAGALRVEYEYLLGSMHRLINYKPLLWMESLWLHSKEIGWKAKFNVD